MSRYQTPYLQYFDGSGNPLAGGFLYFYEAGTSDLKSIYSDNDLTTPAVNPVTLNANGSVSNVFYSGLSRVRLTDSDGIQIFDIDNVGPEDLAGLPPLWVNDSTYSVNDVVKTADGLYYRSIQNGNAGNTPSVASAYWEKVDYIYTYNANTTYRIDDVVKHGGKLWYSVIDANAGNTPGTSNNWRALATGAEFEYLDGGLTQNKYAYPVGTKVLVKMYNSTTQGMASYWVAQATTGPASQLPSARQDLQCTDAAGRVWKLDHNGTVKISTIGGNESADNGSVFRAFADDADYLDLEGKTWPCSSLNTDDAGNRVILNNKVVNGKLVLTNSLSGETNAQTFAPYLDSELQLSQSKSPIIDWEGLSVLWLGTSIPHQGAGADSYPERLADALNFSVQNYAWSGSHAFYDIDGDAFDSGTIRALSMTEADRLAGLATYGSSSAYDDSFDIVTKASQMTVEYRIKNQFDTAPIDAVVLDHNHNDRKNVADYTANDKTITGVTKGTSTVFSVTDATGFAEGDGCYVRITGIDDLDYAAGRVTGVSGLNITVAIDSSSMAGTFSTGTLKWVDRNTIKGAFDFLIAYTKNMFIQYGSADGKIILCGAPSYFTNDVDRDHSIWSSNRVIKEIADEWGLSFFDAANALELTYQDQLTYLPDAVHPSTPETREVFTNVWFKWMRGGAGNYYNPSKVLQRNKVIDNQHDQPALYSKYDSAYASRDVTYKQNDALIDDDFDPGYGSWTAAGTGTPAVVSAPWGSGNAVQFDVTVSNTAPYLQQSASVGNYPVLEFDFYMPDVDVATGVTQQCTIASINSGSGEGYSVGIIQSAGGATSLRVTYNRDGYGTAPVATLPNGRYAIASATKYRVKVDVINGYIQFTVDGNVVYAGPLSNSLLTSNTLVLVGPTFSNMDSAFSVFIGNVIAAPKTQRSVVTTSQLQTIHERYIESYGAVGDGVTDDTAAFNSAIASNRTIRLMENQTYLISGVSKTGISNFKLVGAPNAKIVLADGADARILSFTSSSNIEILDLNVEGNRLNQTVTTDPGAFDGVHFESCDGVLVKGGYIMESAGPGVRGRNTSNMTVDGVKVHGCGARQIYIAPANSGAGSTVENVTVKNCVIDLRDYPSTDVNQWTCISCSHDATSDFSNITAFNNTVYQHPVNTTDSQCIVLAGGTGITYEANKVYNGGLGLSSFKSSGVSCIGNTCIGQKQYGIEIAHETEGMEVVGNTVDCLSIAGSTCVAVNGVAGAVTDAIISDNTLRNANVIISSAAADNASRNQGITITGNRTSGAISRTVSLKWMDDIVSKGNTWNHGGSSAVFRMDECGDFNISDTFKNPAAWCIELLSSVAINIDWGVVSGNIMEDVNFPSVLTNYVKNNLFTGSTVGRVAGRGNVGCPDFVDWFNNVIVWQGNGSPEGNITANIGSEYVRLDGGAGTTHYYKESGTGNTGWVAK